MQSQFNRKEAQVGIQSISEIILKRLPAYQNSAVIRYDDGTRYDSVNGEEYLYNIYRMVHFLNASSDSRQKVIATFCKNRPEWDMTAFASFYSANILFPLDTKMNDDELVHLLSANPPDYILVSAAHRERIQGILGRLGIRTTVLIADLYRVFEDRGQPVPSRWAENEVPLSAIPPATADPMQFKPSPLLDDDDVVLARYSTSGTTSLPKIVCITHGNILFQLNEAMGMINLRKNEDVLSLGPYTHIATLLEFLVAKSKTFTVSYFTRDAEEEDVLENEIKKLKKQNVRIRCLMAVPKFWNFILKEVLEELHNKPVFHNLYRHLVGIEKSDHFYDIGTLDKAKLVAARTLLRNKLGGFFAYGISSSSKIEPGIVNIFSKLGITVIDVYGATEASGVIAKNGLNDSRQGFCGRLLPGFEFKIKEPRQIPGVPHPVGELLLKGSGIAKGYLDDSARLNVDPDGYYGTGDIAYVDEDRWVHLVGRKKELILWENGQYTDPMQISNLLVRSIWVKDGLVVRDGKEGVLSAFIFPDAKRIEKSDIYMNKVKEGLTRDQILRSFLEEAIHDAQSLIGEFPVINKEKIYLLNRKLERTPTHKIKLIIELKNLDYNSFI